MHTKFEEFIHIPIIAINLGLKKFQISLEEQGVEVIQVDWTPMASGDDEMMELLDKLL